MEVQISMTQDKEVRKLAMHASSCIQLGCLQYRARAASENHKGSDKHISLRCTYLVAAQQQQPGL